MNRTLIFFLTWFSLTGLQAQIRISGRILDVETKEPLAFAQIRALNSQLGTISNEDGYYTLSLRNTRNDTFSVSHIGYEYFRIPISSISTPDQFDVLLSERIVELD